MVYTKFILFYKNYKTIDKLKYMFYSEIRDIHTMETQQNIRNL